MIASLRPGEGRSAGRAGTPQMVLVLGLALVGLVALWAASDVRVLEAQATAGLVGWLTRSTTHVAPGTASFYWLMGTSDARGLRVTAECSIGYVIGPLLVLCALLALLRRLPPQRVFAAAAAGASLIVVVNLLRMTMVALAITHFSSERAMWWWHTVVGSIVSLLGIGLGLASVAHIAFGGRAALAAGTADHDSPPRGDT